MITTKAYDARKALDDVFPRLQQNSNVLILCNGMGVYEEVRDELHKIDAKIFLGISTHGTYKTEGDRFSIVHAGKGFIEFGAAESIGNDISADIAKNLDLSSHLSVKYASTKNVMALLWKKLAFNASLNALTAIFKVKNGEIASSASGQRIMADICREVHEASKIVNIDLNLTEQELIEYVKCVCANVSENKSSTLQDVLNKKKTEIDYINGYISDILGKERPSCNSMIRELVHLIEEKY
eukprot:CAMPEP_0171470424 /NCGR_PEP_ID=MMETSP0946-20130122/147_1 /TAXON_ID=109269 /ORGANISM="Vaucheria litorea, Strain CCMP2940" /LENGTH=239 /DNA_ID=CAMNT_0011999813 /DNA_START=248 /DNA_END=967 /DNA_ORIENTATION=+